MVVCFFKTTFRIKHKPFPTSHKAQRDPAPTTPHSSDSHTALPFTQDTPSPGRQSLSEACQALSFLRVFATAVPSASPIACGIDPLSSFRSQFKCYHHRVDLSALSKMLSSCTPVLTISSPVFAPFIASVTV